MIGCTYFLYRVTTLFRRMQPLLSCDKESGALKIWTILLSVKYLRRMSYHFLYISGMKVFHYIKNELLYIYFTRILLEFSEILHTHTNTHTRTHTHTDITCSRPIHREVQSNPSHLMWLMFAQAFLAVGQTSTFAVLKSSLFVNLMVVCVRGV